MKQQIIESLKRKYSNAGLGSELIDGIADILAQNVKEETDIDTAVSNCAPLVAKLQSNFDSLRDARSKAEQRVKELEKEQAKPEPQSKDQKAETKGATPSAQDNPLASVLDALKALQSQVDGLTKEKEQKTLTEQISSALNEKKVPEGYYGAVLKGRTFAPDLDVTAYADDIAKSYEELQQTLSKQRFEGVKPPQEGAPEVKTEDPLAKLIASGTKEIIEAKK